MGVEVIFGFAIGYWIGTRQGREGFQRALDSAQAIAASAETRKLLSEGLAALEAVTGPVLDRLGGKSKGGTGSVISTVMEDVLERRQSRRAAA